MKSRQRRILASFFLFCFSLCIGINAFRHLNILVNSLQKPTTELIKFQDKTPFSFSKSKRSQGTVQFIMDKKENDTQKYADFSVAHQVSSFKYIYKVFSFTGYVSGSKNTIPIYTAVRNYRI